MDPNSPYRPRVLVEAYECSPARSHAPGSAWQILRRLARWYDLHIITEQVQYAEEITRHLESDTQARQSMQFHFLPGVPTGPRRRRPVLPIGEMARYRRWLKRSYHLARRLHDRIGFDLAHHLRGNSFREPGFLWKLPIPFVWGPTGGTNGVPWRLFGWLDTRGRAEHVVRNLVTAVQLRFSPTVAAAARRASLILAQSSHDADRLRHRFHVVPVLAHEQACDPVAELAPRQKRRRLRVAWIGRHVSSKALGILLQAVAGADLRRHVALHIVGNGPCTAAWQAQAANLNLAPVCIWHGWQPQDRTLSILAACDVLVCTSLLEATCTTVMQALSYGVPVLCLDHCGFADVIDENSGIKIPLGPRQRVIAGFAQALRDVIDRPDDLERLRHGAIRCAESHCWEGLALTIRNAYEYARTGSNTGFNASSNMRSNTRSTTHFNTQSNTYPDTHPGTHPSTYPDTCPDALLSDPLTEPSHQTASRQPTELCDESYCIENRTHTI